MCEKLCDSCDFVTKQACEDRHRREGDKNEKRDDKIMEHGETLARVTTILEYVTKQTNQDQKKNFWETKAGTIIVIGLVATFMAVVAYALGVQNVERVLNALPK